mgnify:CR=1 FL=1
MIEKIDLTAIIVAFLSASHIWDRWRSRRQQEERDSRLEAKQDQVLRKLHTNHGKEPGQYLEMIADIKADLGLMRAQLASTSRLQAEELAKLKVRVDQVAHDLAEHVTVGHPT